MENVGFGVIGTGRWGEVHARVFSTTPGAALLGVADVIAERAEALAQKYGANSYSDYRELLADPRIKAISIATPDFAHADIALAAAEAGKHILCEKPLAMSTDECRRIIAATERAGVKLMVDFHARWSPPIYKCWEAIRKAQIGEPQHAYYRLNDRIWVPIEMLSWAGKSTVAWFLGSHGVDTIRWLLGDEVCRVYAVSRSRVLKGMGIDTPDFYQATLEFKSGAVAVMENSWIMPNTMPNIIDFKMMVVGSKGAVYVDGSHHRSAEKYTETEASYPDVMVMPEIYGELRGFAAESIRHFADCVLHDKQPIVTGWDGLQVTKVIEAMEESIRTSGPVELEDE